MNRDETLQRLDQTRELWDIIVIGGGATGLGTAVDAASRGYRTLLLERKDFASGTSSRSTKLIHGGLRYLRQGQVGLVWQALQERRLLLKNAPHLVRPLAFVIPLYQRWERPWYGAGLQLYDLLSGRQRMTPSRHLSRRETQGLAPTLQQQGLRGGLLYHDAQFDDAGLVLALVRTLLAQGGAALNYMEVTALPKTSGRIQGVVTRNVETGQEYSLRSRVVVNATGSFTDDLRNLDEPGTKPIMVPSQGVHLVLDQSFLPGNTALILPRTDDNRVLFAIPWLGRALIGTTDTPIDQAVEEPRPRPEEIDYLLAHAAQLFSRPPSRADIRSVFAGLRPLVGSDHSSPTAKLSRDHTVLFSRSGLVTITGGKWTTYRKMAQDAVDRAAAVAGLEARPCVTAEVPIADWLTVQLNDSPHPSESGSEPLHPDLPYHAADVVLAVREGHARTVEDVLTRRTRSLFLDASASIASAPLVARLLAEELGRNEDWQRQQVAEFTALAGGYCLPIT